MKSLSCHGCRLGCRARLHLGDPLAGTQPCSPWAARRGRIPRSRAGYNNRQCRVLRARVCGPTYDPALQSEVGAEALRSRGARVPHGDDTFLIDFVPGMLISWRRRGCAGASLRVTTGNLVGFAGLLPELRYTFQVRVHRLGRICMCGGTAFPSAFALEFRTAAAFNPPKGPSERLQ